MEDIDYKSVALSGIKLTYYSCKVLTIRFLVQLLRLQQNWRVKVKETKRQCRCGSALFVIRTLAKGQRTTEITVCMECDRGKCKACGESAGYVLATGPQRCTCGGQT